MKDKVTEIFYQLMNFIKNTSKLNKDKLF